MKFIHCADLHIDSPMRGLRALDSQATLALKNIIRQSFENIIEACITYDIEALLIAGDIFDGQSRDYNTSLWLNRQFARIPNTRIFLIHGNHDYSALHQQIKSWPSHVHVFEAERATTVSWTNRDGETVAIHGQSFGRKAVFENLVLGYPEAIANAVNIGLLHCSLEGSKGHDPYAPCQMSDLEDKDYSYWALGHIHQTSILKAGKSHPFWVVYPGNIQGRHARELGKKGFILAETQHGLVIERPKFVASDVLRWQCLDLELTDRHEHSTLIIQDLCSLASVVLEEQESRMLALRINIKGQSSLYAYLFENWQDFETQVRSALSEIEFIWLEKIKLLCQPLPDESFNQPDNDIIKYIKSEFDLLKNTETERKILNTWIEEIEPICGDLGRRTYLQEDSFASKICENAEQILLNKLLSDSNDET